MMMMMMMRLEILLWIPSLGTLMFVPMFREPFKIISKRKIGTIFFLPLSTVLVDTGIGEDVAGASLQMSLLVSKAEYSELNNTLFTTDKRCSI